MNDPALRSGWRIDLKLENNVEVMELNNEDKWVLAEGEEERKRKRKKALKRKPC